MLPEEDIDTPWEDEAPTSATKPLNASVEVYETNLGATAHELDKEESLSATLTLFAAGFGLISDGCNGFLPCLCSGS